MALAPGKPAPYFSSPALSIQRILVALRTKIRDGMPDDNINIKVKNAAVLLQYVEDGLRLRQLVDIYSQSDPDEMSILETADYSMPLDLDAIRMVIDSIEYRRKELHYKQGGFE